jgi:hypothetical protein
MKEERVFTFFRLRSDLFLTLKIFNLQIQPFNSYFTTPLVFHLPDL